MVKEASQVSPANYDVGSEVSNVLAAIWRRKARVAIIALICAVAAYVLTTQITPEYRARSVIMLDPRSVQVFSFDDVVQEASVNDRLLDTEAVVLSSNILLERVIETIGLDRLSPIDPALEPPSLVDRARAVVSLGRARALQAAGVESEPAAPIEFLLSEEDREMRRFVGAIRESLTVRREGDSYLIAVIAETPDPELSMLLANGIVAEYMNVAVEDRAATLEDASSFLSQRVAETRSELETAESDIEDFRARQLELGGMSLDSINQQLLDLSTQLALARADRLSTEAQFRHIEDITDHGDAEVAPELQTSPLVQSLRAEIAQLQRDDAELAARHGPEHPDRRRVAVEIGLITNELMVEVGLIIASMETDVEVARIREQSLVDSLRQMETRAAQQGRASLELRNLEREAQVASLAYEAALARLNETRALQQISGGNQRLIERAVIPGGPSSPQTLLLTAFGGIVGLSIGIVLAYLSAVSRDTFRRVSDLESAVSLPVIGSLGQGSWRKADGMLRGFSRGRNLDFVDRLRQIYSILKLRRGSKSLKTLLVTSPVQGEGKSTVCTALAHMLGDSNQKALLLDFDARKLGTSRVLQYNPVAGDLVDFLSGRCELNDAISKPQNLLFDVLSTKQPVSNIDGMISSDRFKSLMIKLKQEYDLVVIDTPPLLSASDGLSLVAAADATLLLVKQGETKRTAVMESIKQLTEISTKSLYLVLNMANKREEENYFGLSRERYYGSAR